MPRRPLREKVVCGSIVYLVIFTIVRVVVRCQGAADVAISKLLVIVLVDDAAENASRATTTPFRSASCTGRRRELLMGEEPATQSASNVVRDVGDLKIDPMNRRAR